MGAESGYVWGKACLYLGCEPALAACPPGKTYASGKFLGRELSR
jgi:hypothetical protein